MNDFKDVERRLPQELIDRYKNIHPAELGHVIEFGVVSPEIMPVLQKPFYFVGPAVTCRISPVCSVSIYEAFRRARPGGKTPRLLGRDRDDLCEGKGACGGACRRPRR